MQLAVYHPWTYLQGGIERLLLELMGRSRHQWTLYTHHFEPDATFPELAAQPVVELSPRISVRRSLASLSRAAAVIATARIPQGHRALLVSSEGLGDLLMVRARLPTACYCHTPLKILHDPSARAALRERNNWQAGAQRVIGPVFEHVDRTMWRRYGHVFVNSRETEARVHRAGLRSAGAIEVLYPGVDPERFRRPHVTRRPLFLVAGRIMWQKNVEVAIDAFSLARARGLEADLVIAGAADAKSQAYVRSLRERAQGMPVRFEPNCSDEVLARLYSEAIAVVFTPPNEDFGIVPLEAMSAGTPVLAVDGGGTRESIVDGITGWLLPNEADSFADRMCRVMKMGEELGPMRQAAVRRALEFHWDRFVARIDEVMEDLVAGRRSS